MKKETITGVIVESSSPLSLAELAQALTLQPDIIIEMVDYRLLEPQGHSPDEWQFDDICLKRARLAASFHRDLEVNMAGIALALDLMDEIAALEKRLHTLEAFED